MFIDFPRYMKALHKINILFFGILGAQMMIIPLVTGLIALEFFPPAGIFWIICGVWLVAGHYYHKGWGKFFTLVAGAVTIFLLIYWTSIFSGPFDQVLQIFFYFMMALNVIGLGGLLILPIIKLILEKVGRNERLGIIVSNAKRSRERRRKRSVAIFTFMFGALAFFPLAMFDFGRVYRVQAPDTMTTRSSFWGPPYRNTTTATTSINPVDNRTLLIENANLGAEQDRLRPGSIMYVHSVTHASTGSTNYCDYDQGARSFPNGSVYLSQDLPSLVNVTISFKYMLNAEIYQYMNQLNSRMIHGGYFGNASFVDSPNLFYNIGDLYDLLMLEYWNISYFMNIPLAGYKYVNIYNYNAVTSRAMDVLDWVAISEPSLNHCIGIAFDFEPENVTAPSMNQDRPEMGEPIDSPFVSVNKWYRLNEQNDAVLEAAKAAYFAVFDHAAELGLGTYATFVYYAMEDMAEGDIDYTRLPLWKHPEVEYGMMGYQSKDPDAEAMWQIYLMNKNQQTVYGDQGYSILTGWLTYDEAVHLEYYTNDQAGLDRYLRDIKLHQACGAKELVHAPLYGLTRKWGEEVVLEFEKVLNVDPKEEFVFRAHPWGHLDTTLYDIVENYNKMWVALPTFLAQAGILISAVIMKGRSKSLRDEGKIGEEKES